LLMDVLHEAVAHDDGRTLRNMGHTWAYVTKRRPSTASFFWRLSTLRTTLRNTPENDAGEG